MEPQSGGRDGDDEGVEAGAPRGAAGAQAQQQQSGGAAGGSGLNNAPPAVRDSPRSPAPPAHEADVGAGEPQQQQQQEEQQVLGSPARAPAPAPGPASPAAGRPTVSQLQLRVQALEVQVEQAAQREAAAVAALGVARAAHVAEEASLRSYYDALLADRGAELALLAQQVALAEQLAPPDAPPPPGSPAANEQPAAPMSPQRALSPTVAAVGGRPASRGGAGASVVASSLAGERGGGVSRSMSLTDLARLRRELAAAEALLASYQDENRAAARRIKDLEGQLAAARTALADEAGRAQRAVATASEVQRGGSEAAERLTRQLQLEGQLQEAQAEWHARERQLVQQLDAARREAREVAARAAAAAEARDKDRWQADDALVSELRAELAEQAGAHAAALAALRDKLAWHTEQQALLGAGEGLVLRQAELIRHLEARLADGSGGAGAAAAHSGADAVALEAARATIAQLEAQAETQEAALRGLARQCEALQARLEARRDDAAAAPSRGRVRELAQQLDEQREMSARRIRALEARLAEAERQAAAAERAAAASGKRRSGAGAGRPVSGGRAAPKAVDEAGAAPFVAAATQERQGGSGAGEPATAAPAGEAAAGSSAPAGDLRDRQLAALTAQLQERTSQFLKLQQKLRAAERQLKAAAADQQRQQRRQPPRSHSEGAASSSGSADGGSPAGSPREADSRAGSSSRRSAARSALEQRADVQSAADVPPRAAPPLPPKPAGAASSWPALCAELESENEALKAALAALREAAAQRDQAAAASPARLRNAAAQATSLQQQQQQQQLAAPALPSLLAVAEEAAAREAARWRERVAALDEALHAAHAEAAAARHELAMARSGAGWGPSAAAFDALERKLASLEAAQRQQSLQQSQTQSQSQQQLGLLPGLGGAELGAVVAHYEARLAAKAAELDGFRSQLDALLAAAKAHLEQGG
ncbi:hypothetical protein HT031_006455 [Scenedesmus sp. PABB004]|nr:hypothetical protein HT031_006455 [Scenedesmus sp. PABB004]